MVESRITGEPGGMGQLENLGLDRIGDKDTIRTVTWVSLLVLGPSYQ